MLLCAISAVAAAVPAMAATLCVNTGGTGGCYKTIGDAVAAAADNDTINVGAGNYAEDVVIGRPLSLVGANYRAVIIDATGLANGIYINGMDNPGLANVMISGITVENANLEGILVANASTVTLSANRVMHNNLGLTAGAGGPSCANLPDWELNEAFDCGEGIHLTGVDHSVVANNVVENNAGGILLSDDTGPTWNNLVSGNLVDDNSFDCGITLASHPSGEEGLAKPSKTRSRPVRRSSFGGVGVNNNTIANNIANHNGTRGEGSGIGVFSAGPGGMVNGNVIINNRVRSNGIPGIAFHSHTPFDDLNDNMVVANQISSNGADLDDAATPGSTGINIFGVSPITGTIISQNMIFRQQNDIVINTPSPVDVHLNNLMGTGKGVNNIGSGTVSAVGNWWNCATGPGTTGCTVTGGSDILWSPFQPTFFAPIRVVPLY
jgi:parallel beta-helix repeat protein